MTKYKINILFIFLITILTINIIKAEEKDKILKDKIIYIDPGHGGLDPGATYKDVKEANINLELSTLVKQELEQYGATVLMTRDNNYDLSEKNAKNKKRSDLQKRANLINNSNCDLFLSIHLNSDKSPTWYGAQVFYTKQHIDNQKIANIIQEKMKKEINTKRKEKQIKNTYLYEKIKRPGVLIEAGFISNPTERNKLTDSSYQQLISKIIVEGTIEYLINK